MANKKRKKKKGCKKIRALQEYLFWRFRNLYSATISLPSILLQWWECTSRCSSWNTGLSSWSYTRTKLDYSWGLRTTSLRLLNTYSLIPHLFGLVFWRRWFATRSLCWTSGWIWLEDSHYGIFLTPFYGNIATKNHPTTKVSTPLNKSETLPSSPCRSCSCVWNKPSIGRRPIHLSTIYIINKGVHHLPPIQLHIWSGIHLTMPTWNQDPLHLAGPILHRCTMN